MSTPQQIRLRWTSHQGTILSLFDALLSNESLVDVTLAAEGKYLKAHKVILASCSPFFQELLSLHHGDKHAIVFLKDVKYSHLQALISYMYRGEVNILQTELQPLLSVAESLQIRGLSEHSFNKDYDPSVLATTHFLGGGSIASGTCSTQSKETIILPPIDTASCANSNAVINTCSSNSASTNLPTAQAPSGNNNFSNALIEKQKVSIQLQLPTLASHSLSSLQKVQRPATNITQRAEEKSTLCSSSPSKPPVLPIRLSNFSATPTSVPQEDRERTKAVGSNLLAGQQPCKRIRIDQGPIFRQSSSTNTSSVISTPITSVSTSSNTFHANSSNNSVQIQSESSKPRQGSGVVPVPVEIPSFEIIPKAESPVVVNLDDDEDDEGPDDSRLVNENSQNDTWTFDDTELVDTTLRGGPGEILNQSDEDPRTSGTNSNDPNGSYDSSLIDNNILGESPSMHQCPTCLKLYQVKGSLLRHLKYECQRPPRFRCDYCGIKFRHGFRLASHKTICKLKP